jgi:hypothetical protein
MNYTKNKKPPKCASKRGMEGVLSLVLRTFFKIDPEIIIKIFRFGSGNAKVQQFFTNGTPYSRFFLFLMDEIHASLTEHFLQ